MPPLYARDCRGERPPSRLRLGILHANAEVAALCVLPGKFLPLLPPNLFQHCPKNSRDTLVAVVEGTNLTYAYPKDTSKADIIYLVEVSTDLNTWTPLADVLVETNGNIETRKASVPLSGIRQYLRLKVTR